MINANLLPPEVKNEISQTKQNRVILRYFWLAILIFICAIGIFATGWYYFSMQLKADQSALNSAQGKNEKFGALTEKSKSLADKINTVKAIDDHTNKWSGIITEIQKVMPSGAYLTSVKIDSDSRVRNQISGYASSKQIVASLRDSLENSPKFEYVDIDSSKTVTDPTTHVDQENFTLSFSLEKGALK